MKHNYSVVSAQRAFGPMHLLMVDGEALAAWKDKSEALRACGRLEHLEDAEADLFIVSMQRMIESFLA